eukprot:TRINITY_DN93713_c0_g1_i1.p2 TRINITY_DN93713_c0_g1~~TRINITY_DN93713_c0_g1_i1.p2  ORF type:complete len:179 (+),score=20.38 TRINITY_DN93713_c0_g1_i1:57-593(+)
MKSFGCCWAPWRGRARKVAQAPDSGKDDKSNPDGTRKKASQEALPGREAQAISFSELVPSSEAAASALPAVKPASCGEGLESGFEQPERSGDENLSTVHADGYCPPEVSWDMGPPQAAASTAQLVARALREKEPASGCSAPGDEASHIGKRSILLAGEDFYLGEISWDGSSYAHQMLR